MSVENSKKKRTHFDVVAKAEEMAKYTIHITANPKHFDPKYWNPMTSQIVYLAKDIFMSERKKLVRQVHLARKGLLPKKSVDASFETWCSHAAKGNTYKVMHRTKQFYYDLWRQNEDSKAPE